MHAGLTDKIRFFRYTITEDAFMGEESETATESVIYASVAARATLLTAKATLDETGVSGTDTWKITSDYAELATADSVDGEGVLMLALVAGTTSRVLRAGEVYEVHKIRHQQDHTGSPHHSTAWVTRR